MVTYDPGVIRTHAQGLYFKSGLIIVIYFGIGSVVSLPAFFASYLFFTRASTPTDGEVFLFLILHWVVFACLGLMVGLIKSFNLRLQAQIALCLVTIEENTRPRI